MHPRSPGIDDIPFLDPIFSPQSLVLSCSKTWSTANNPLSVIHPEERLVSVKEFLRRVLRTLQDALPRDPQDTAIGRSQA